MNEQLRNSLVGLFVIASFVMLALLMIWFGEAPQWLGKGDWKLTIAGVKEINGVGEGSAVYLNGVEIGRVVNLDFEDPKFPELGVFINANIKHKYNIPKDSTAKIYGAVFGFGQGKINIVPNPGARDLLDRHDARLPGVMAKPFGDILDPKFTDSLEKAIDSIGDLAARAAPMADNLTRLLEPRTIAQVDAPGAAAAGITSNLSTAVERFDKLVANANEVIGDDVTQGEFKGIVTELKATSSEIHKLVQSWSAETTKLATNLNEGIDHTDENIATTLREMNDVLGKLDTSADSLVAILSNVEQGKGTAGMLVRDERLYESAVYMLKNFAELSATIQRIAGKIENDGYITVGQKVGGVTFTKDFPVKPEEKSN